MITAEAIIPNVNLTNSAQLILQAVQTGLDDAAKEIQQEYAKTTATFSTPVVFDIEKPESFIRIIKTTDRRYVWLDRGTQGHFIEPVTAKALRFTLPFSPKTSARVINSSAGSRGDSVHYATRIWNPGVQPREFTKTIAKRYQEGRLLELIQARLSRARGQ